jgi:hypothetical protein
MSFDELSKVFLGRIIQCGIFLCRKLVSSITTLQNEFCHFSPLLSHLWSSGQSSWLQIQRSLFDSRHYRIFGEVPVLERGPLSIVSTTEELLERKVAVPVYKTEITAVGTPSLSSKVGINFADQQRSPQCLFLH